MKKFSRPRSPRFIPSILLAVISGALCFSVGEGLRLTTFPVSSLTEITETNTFVVGASNKISLSQYGPIDVPVQAQKRGKRQALDLAGPDSAGTRKLVTSCCYLFEYEAVDTSSLLFVPRSAGRAPPSFS